jgi:hypothetical protein
MNVGYVRGTTAVLVILAVVSLQFARGDHIHPAGIEGRSQALVHNHVIDVSGTGGARAYAAHGDHGLAIFLSPTFESVLRNLPPPANHDLALPYDPAAGAPSFRAIGVVPEHIFRHPPGSIASLAERAPPVA